MNDHPLLILFAQVALILVLSRVMGMLFARLRQPQVMGEMVAGILLGPSLLGWAAPQAYQAIFPEHSRELLNLLSQLGVVFFLFLIGLDFDPALIRKRGRTALAVSAASIAVPFVLGIGLAFSLYGVFDERAREHFTASALFVAAAISVTAFPVLARILTERNLHKTHVGAIAITCAAVNDVLAWCMLAFVVAVAQYRGPKSALWTAGLAAGFILLMLLVVRPFLRRLQLIYDRQGRLSQNVVAVIFLLLLASAYASERIGIHALFGAFLLGSVMPKTTRFIRHVTDKLEDFTIVFLLPIFFAYAGLNTNLLMLKQGTLVGYTLLVIAVACVGKFGGSAVTARLCGMTWRESSAVGILMNTRGLMELVILTIGLQLGVINAPIYAMMVIMAIVTTALTTPLLHWVYPARLLAEAPVEAGKQEAEAFPILIAVSLPRSAVPMLHLAEILSAAQPGSRRVTALSLRPPIDHEAFRGGLDSDDRVNEALEPLLADAHSRGVNVEPLSFVSRDVPNDIAAIARSRQADLVLIGFHKPVMTRTILGGTVHRILQTCPANVGILVDRGLHSVKRILVPYLGSRHDRLALQLASRMARNTEAQVTVLHVVAPRHGQAMPALDAKGNVQRIFNDPSQPAPVAFRVVEHSSPVDAVLAAAKEFDLILIGVAEQWGLESHLFGFRAERIARDSPTSLLIVRQHDPVEAGRRPAVPVEAETAPVG